MECVAYLRVSTEKQAEEGNGLQSQKRDIQLFAGKNNMLISEWYVDDGYTGANMERPGLQKLIRDCCSKKVKNIIAFKLDRLSRNMVDGIYIIEKIFLPNGVNFQCVHDSVSYDSPMEQAYTQMMAVFSQLDKNTMLLRMRGGMLERIKKGYWMGGGNTPYCYRYDKNLGIIIPITERKEKANRALDLFIEGYSDARIKDMLGFKSEFVVRRVLTGVVNIGKIPYKGEIYQGLHEPVFDLEKFELGLKLREQRKKSKSYSVTNSNVLTGLCYCGVCGCKMRYQKWTNGQHKIYCCSRNSDLHYLPNYNPRCNNSLEWADEIEKAVESEIMKIALDVDGLKRQQKKAIAEVLEEEIESCNQKLKRLYLIYAEGNDAIVGTIQDIEKQKENLKEKLEQETKNKTSSKKQEETLSEIKKIADIWKDADKIQKNKILKTIIDKILIVNGDIEIQLKNY